MTARRRTLFFLSSSAVLLAMLGCGGAASSRTAETAPVPRIDHHQHVLSPALAKVWKQPGPVGAERVIQQLDKAGIRGAVVLSVAYAWGSPGLSEKPADEYMAVRAENDWTAEQAAKYPDRLTAF